MNRRYPPEWWWIMGLGFLTVVVLGLCHQFDGGAYAHNLRLTPWWRV